MPCAVFEKLGILEPLAEDFNKNEEEPGLETAAQTAPGTSSFRQVRFQQIDPSIASTVLADTPSAESRSAESGTLSDSPRGDVEDGLGQGADLEKLKAELRADAAARRAEAVPCDTCDVTGLRREKAEDASAAAAAKALADALKKAQAEKDAEAAKEAAKAAEEAAKKAKEEEAEAANEDSEEDRDDEAKKKRDAAIEMAKKAGSKLKDALAKIAGDAINKGAELAKEAAAAAAAAAAGSKAPPKQVGIDVEMTESEILDLFTQRLKAALDPIKDLLAISEVKHDYYPSMFDP